jgi:hypothetical protein
MPASTAYTLIVLGYDERNRLPEASTDPGAPGAEFTVAGGCRPCSMARRIVVSPSVVAPRADAFGYQAGPNDVPTDTKELYVLKFPDRASGNRWLLANKDGLIGKKVYSIDEALSP